MERKRSIVYPHTLMQLEAVFRLVAFSGVGYHNTYMFVTLSWSIFKSCGFTCFRAYLE